MVHSCGRVYWRRLCGRGLRLHLQTLHPPVLRAPRESPSRHGFLRLHPRVLHPQVHFFVWRDWVSNQVCQRQEEGQEFLCHQDCRGYAIRDFRERNYFRLHDCLWGIFYLIYNIFICLFLSFNLLILKRISRLIPVEFTNMWLERISEVTPSR